MCVRPLRFASTDPGEHHRQRQRQRAASGTPASAGTAGGATPASGPQRSRSVSFRVPDSDDGGSDGSDDGGAVTSGFRGPAHAAPGGAASSGGRRAPPPDPMHAVHLARARQLRRQVQASYASTTQQLAAELVTIEEELVGELRRVAAEAQD